MDENILTLLENPENGQTRTVSELTEYLDSIINKNGNESYDEFKQKLSQ